MSGSEQILVGITLIIISMGALFVSLPRKGKTVWFARMPVLASGVPIVIIGMFAIGIILVAAYFTTIDNATLTGAVKQL